MIFHVEKVCEFEERKDYVIVIFKYPKILFIGGTKSQGLLQSLSLFDMETNTLSEFPCENEQLLLKLKRIGHTANMLDQRLFILGGQHPFGKSLLIIDTETWTFTEKILEKEFIYHSTLIDVMQRTFYIFTGLELYLFDENFESYEKFVHSPSFTHFRNRYTMTMHQKKLFIFGGHNGITHGKRFFFFDVMTKTFTFLPSIPNSYFMRLTSTNIHIHNDHLFLICGFYEIQRNNFFYIFNLQTLQWENNYIMYHKKVPHVINIFGECKISTDLKNGMRNYLSFFHRDSFYIFTGGSIIFHSKNDLYRIQMKMLNPGMLRPLSYHYDFEFITKTKRFPCHKTVLVQHSRYFQTLFQSSYTEALVESIELHDFDNDIIESFLEYMYQYPHYKFQVNNKEKAIALLEVTDYFEATHCMYDLETFLISNSFLLIALKKEKLKNLSVFPRLATLM
jgi:hypothetical protein